MIRKYYYPARSHTRYFDDFITKALWEVAQAQKQTQKNRKNGPAVNIKEAEGSYLIELAVPGLRKEDFELSLEENKLTVAIKQPEATNDTEKAHYIRREFDLNAFQRTFVFKDNTFDVDGIEAKYEDGVLCITLPKKAEVEPQRIEIA